MFRRPFTATLVAEFFFAGRRAGGRAGCEGRPPATMSAPVRRRWRGTPNSGHRLPGGGVCKRSGLLKAEGAGANPSAREGKMFCALPALRLRRAPCRFSSFFGGGKVVFGARACVIVRQGGEGHCEKGEQCIFARIQ